MNSNDKTLHLVECPHCKKKVPQTDFCTTCGKKIGGSPKLNQEQSLESTTCPHCNQNVPQTPFCIHCGQLISKEPVPPEELLPCPLCREDIPQGHPFCHFCGAKLQTRVEAGLQTVICNNCWKSNPPNTGYCVHCGTTNLGKKFKQSLLLDQPFEGFQVDLPQLLKPTSVPLKIISQNSRKSFPVKSTILHSRYFGVRLRNQQALSFLNKNFGGYNRENITNYLGSFVIVLMIYFFWYSNPYSVILEEVDPLIDGSFVFFSGLLLTLLLLMPLLLATFLVHRKSGYHINYRLDTSRVLITIIFNFLWAIFGGGPIILRLGDIKNTEDRAIKNYSFMKGIGWGSLFTVISTVLIALLTMSVIGLPGTFAGFLFQDQLVKGHVLTLFFGATWISLILILPLGDFYDRVLKEWNLVAYFLMLVTAILILLYSYEVLAFISRLIF